MVVVEVELAEVVGVVEVVVVVVVVEVVAVGDGVELEVDDDVVNNIEVNSIYKIVKRLDDLFYEYHD